MGTYLHHESFGILQFLVISKNVENVEPQKRHTERNSFFWKVPDLIRLLPHSAFVPVLEMADSPKQELGTLTICFLNSI